MNGRFDLTGRSVIVTGGGKGIGKVYVEEFARAGARVLAADIDEAAAKSPAIYCGPSRSKARVSHPS